MYEYVLGNKTVDESLFKNKRDLIEMILDEKFYKSYLRELLLKLTELKNNNNSNDCAQQ